MLTVLFHLLIAAIVIGILVWIVARVNPPAPASWIVWAIVFILALIILLPLVGVHMPLGA
jgi:hypothetical protein